MGAGLGLTRVDLGAYQNVEWHTTEWLLVSTVHLKWILQCDADNWRYSLAVPLVALLFSPPFVHLFVNRITENVMGVFSWNFLEYIGWIREELFNLGSDHRTFWTFYGICRRSSSRLMWKSKVKLGKNQWWHYSGGGIWAGVPAAAYKDTWMAVMWAILRSRLQGTKTVPAWGFSTLVSAGFFQWDSVIIMSAAVASFLTMNDWHVLCHLVTLASVVVWDVNLNEDCIPQPPLLLDGGRQLTTITYSCPVC